jgi:DNA-binding response OmpR family regulator
MDKKEIVILEDDEYISKLLKYKLSSAGFNIKLYESPENVIDYITMDRPDLIISDVMMPYQNGIEFLKIVKADDLVKDIPVILLTALGHEDAVIKGLDAGATDYITKPFSTAELVLRVNKALKN